MSKGRADRHDRASETHGRPEPINIQYPSSWWAIGFSEEVNQGEVVPVKVLERDVILWRSHDRSLHCQSAICPHLGANIGYGGEVVGDTVRCPFHGYRYDVFGAACARLGEAARAPTRLCLQTYPVDERYGTIFVWNGYNPPDHDVPDLLGDVLAESPGLEPEDVRYYRHAFYLPFPAKWFCENIPDANHFAGIHRVCDWGEAEVIDESPTILQVNLRLRNPKPFLTWENVRQHARLGQLLNPVAPAGDVNMTTYGGGIHVAKFAERVDADQGKVGRMLQFIDSARGIACWTPVTARSHVNRYTFLLPRLQVPFLARAFEPVINYLIAKRGWGGIVQDCAMMRYRQEPPNPAYGRLDRGLVKFRRLWDRRLRDQSLWEGDNLHSNGIRAGIRWGHDSG